MNKYNVYGRNRYCRDQGGNWYPNTTLLIYAETEEEAAKIAMKKWKETYQMADDIELLRIEQLNKPKKGEQLELIC